MRNIFGNMLIVMAAMMSAACVEDITDAVIEESSEKIEMVFSASCADDTKATLVNGTEVWWQPDDCIYINGDCFWTTISEPCSKAGFVGETMPADTYNAVYTFPYYLLEFDGNDCYVHLNDQTAVRNDIPIFISTAKCGSDMNLHFKNMLGYVKFTIPESGGWPINRVEVRTIGNEEIAGKRLVDFSEEYAKFIDYEEFHVSVVSLQSDEAMEPGDYYIAMYPGTFKKGLKFTFYSSDGRIAIKRIQQEVTLEKGVIKDIGVVKDLQNQSDIDRSALIDLYNVAGGDAWYDNTNWCSDKPLNEWYGVKVSPEGLVYSLTLNLNNLTGSLEEVLSTLYDIEGLEDLYLHCNYELSGEIPKSINKFRNLRTMYLSQCNLKGSIPSEMAELEGLDILDIRNCGLEGDIPKSFQETSIWSLNWMRILTENHFNKDSYAIYMPEFNATLDDGTSIDNSYFENNEYTIIYFAGLDNPYADIYNPYIVSTYEKYKDRGVGALTLALRVEMEAMKNYSIAHSIPWNVFSPDEDCFTLVSLIYLLPSVILVDRQGRIVFESYTEHRNLLDMYLENAIEMGTGSLDLYESKDYSIDGTVEVIRSASKGNGIDIVVLGDAYSDKLIKDGTFKKDAEVLDDMIFSKEPLASLKEYFNVYAVCSVSKHHKYWGDYETVFKPAFTEYETLIGVDNEIVMQYAGKAISNDRMKSDALIAVLLRDSNITTGNVEFINYDIEWQEWWTDEDYLRAMGDFGRGSAIVSIPWALGYDMASELVLKDLVGSGFAKLCDELTGPRVFLSWYKELGWYKNVSIGADGSVPWSHFMEDERYADDGLGIYDAGIPYQEIYTATEENIMNRKSKEFNAPSREAIYYRVHKLAYGPDWEYDYEKFVEYDAINRK